MSNEVDLFSDERAQPPAAPEGAAPSSKAATAKKRRKRRSPLSDPIIQRMAMGMAAMIILWTAAIASSIVFGISNPPAPRTAAERQLNMLEKVVREKPKSTEAWADYASALIAAKQYSQAETVIDRGLKVANEKSLIMVQQAVLAQDRGDTDKALDLAMKAAVKAREERKADSKLLERTGSRARLFPKGLPGALVIIAEIQQEKGDLSAAVKTWTDFLQYEPTDCIALVARGDAQAKLGDKKGAEQSYREALKYIPDMPEALKGLKAIGAENK